MTLQDLEMLYDYHYWANDKIIPIVSEFSPSEFTQPVAGGYKSIRNTMVHLLSTEWGWLSRCGGFKRGNSLNPGDYPTIESLLDDWDSVEVHMRQFLSQLKDSDLSEKVHYSGKGGEKRTMPRGELLHHIIIHGTHHRGQIAVLLRELGYEPGSFDILFYYAERHGVPAW